MTTKLSSDKGAVVETEWEYRPMHSCPRGKKVILYPKTGVAYFGNGPDGFAIGWAPLPKVPDWMKEGRK